MGTEEGQHELESTASLPVLCIEDGSVILRFSEIFGIQEPSRKVKTDHHKRPANKGMLLIVVLGSQPSWSFFSTFSAVPLGCLCPLDQNFNSGDMASHLGN
jgi:hypothetical protein